METFRALHIEGHLFFVTATIVDWVRILKKKQYRDIVLNSLKWLHTNDRIKLYAFVIMPNHLHFISKPTDEYSINQILQIFSSFTAHEFLKNLKIGDWRLLKYFKDAAQKENLKSKHHFWQKIQAKNIYSVDYLKQKLEYVHNNPIAKNWQLANERSDYEYSSACFYDKGSEPIIPIDDIRKLMV